MKKTGAQLAQTLIGTYRVLVDTAIAELAARGHPDVKPVHEFAMQAIVTGADNATELGRRLSVSKQAAAKTIQTLLDRGYIERTVDPEDSRRKRLQVTPRGFAMIRRGEAIFDELRSRWETRIGKDQFALLEEQLTTLAGETPMLPDTLSWLSAD
jgi:DNA-binding MarR family transcriptional regulator